MVGNDVVDLGDAESAEGATHPRFDARVFCEAERAWLAGSPLRNRRRWLLWAAKEAAYKLGVRRVPGLVFSPRRFVVELDEDLEGSVRYPGGVARVHVREAGGAIHAVATRDDAGRVLAETASTPQGGDASRAVRELARRGVAKALGIAPDALELGRRGRVPTLRRHDTGHMLELSLSHHGRYVGFACALGEVAR